MRLMDNCSLEVSEVKDLQDDLNYYLESNQEPDFAENEMMYDDLDLEDVQIYQTPRKQKTCSKLLHSYTCAVAMVFRLTSG